MPARRALLIVVPILAAGALHSLLPAGAFGSHDIALRALATGLTGAIVTMAVVVLGKRARIR